MPIAKITGQGLGAIALAVALLWGCFVGEQLTVKHAAALQSRVMLDLHRLQRNRQAEPVSTPRPSVPRPTRVTIG
jgi:hypothetical protein